MGKKLIVDSHHHWIPPDVIKNISGFLAEDQPDEEIINGQKKENFYLQHKLLGKSKRVDRGTP